MKKRNILDLIKHHVEKNEHAFIHTAYEIANDFDASGDMQLAEYIAAMLSDASVLLPQEDDSEGRYLSRVSDSMGHLLLPKAISDDMDGIMNAMQRHAGVSKFLLQGPPGTGKTESVRHIAHLLDRVLLIVDFDSVIDSKLGQTSRNIAALFNEINQLPSSSHYIVLFDEIDAIVLDRINRHDVREMGRATSSFFRGLDSLKEDVSIFATTNLYDQFDRALTRRFDTCIDYGRYDKEDLVNIASTLMEDLLARNDDISRDMRLFNRIVENAPSLPYPGELHNILRTCVAFSSSDNTYDYLARLYRTLYQVPTLDVRTMRAQGFTLREMEHVTGISRSTLSRELKETKHE